MKKQKPIYYSNKLTKIERLNIISRVSKGDTKGLLQYLQDCVIWKRLKYRSVIEEYDADAEVVESEEELLKQIEEGSSKWDGDWFFGSSKGFGK